MNTKRKIEVFTAGCEACEETVTLVKEIACSSCDVEILDMIRCVDAVTAGCALWPRQQPTALVIPNRLWLNADPVGQITGAKNAALHNLRVKS